MSESCTCPQCIEKTRPKGHHKLCRCSPCRTIDNTYLQTITTYPTIYPTIGNPWWYYYNNTGGQSGYAGYNTTGRIEITSGGNT